MNKNGKRIITLSLSYHNPFLFFASLLYRRLLLFPSLSQPPSLPILSPSPFPTIFITHPSTIFIIRSSSSSVYRKWEEKRMIKMVGEGMGDKDGGRKRG